ncbi:MAG: CT620/CT621 family type III secretion system effector [Victivallaceae bacterium]
MIQNSTEIKNDSYNFLFNIKCSHANTKIPYSCQEFEILEKYRTDKTVLKRLSLIVSALYDPTTRVTPEVKTAYLPENIKKQKFFVAETNTEIPSLPPTDPVNIENTNLLITAIESAIKTAQSQNVILITLLSPLLDRLNAIKNVMPNPTEEDLTQLYNLATLPSAEILSKYLTEDQQTAYRATIAAAFQAMVKNLSSAQNTTTEQTTEAENAFEVFQSAQTNILGLMSQTNLLLQSGSSQSYAQAMTEGFTLESLYASLGEIYQTLPSDEQQAINVYINNLLSTGICLTTATVPMRNLAQVIAAIMVYQEASLYVFENPTTDFNNLKTYLMNTLLPKVQQYPGGVIVTNALRIMINNHLYNSVVTSNLSNPTIIDQFPSTIMTSAFASPTNVDGSGYQALSDAESIYTITFKTINLIKTENLNKLSLYFDSLDPANAAFLPQMQFCQSLLIESQNLGEAFIRMILVNYLPQQNAFLDPLIKSINFNNIGANIINRIIQLTNSFSSSGVYYNFTSYLSQSKEGKDLFTGNVSETIVAKADEMQRIRDDLIRSELALQEISSALKDIEAMTDVTIYEKRNMSMTLENYQYFFSTIKKQLIDLYNLLNNLQITPDKTNTFKILSNYRDWLTALGTLEGTATSGYVSASPTGGLSTIFTQVQSDQQNYTNQSQTQQLNLQNQMTTIQQEWTIISTAFQIFNQILTKLATKVYEM